MQTERQTYMPIDRLADLYTIYIPIYLYTYRPIYNQTNKKVRQTD